MTEVRCSGRLAKGREPSSGAPSLIVNAPGLVPDVHHPHLLEGGDVGDVVVPPLPLLLLELDGDAPDGAPLQPLHQVSDEPGNLRLSLQNHAMLLPT